MALGVAGSSPGGREQQKDAPAEKKAGAAAVAKGAAARRALEEHRQALAKDRVHSCCIQPSCAFCQIAADGCPCGKHLAAGEPVCPECWGGWQAGYGHLEDVEPAKVKIVPKDKLKMLYEMKEKAMNKAAAK
jgi:hypothetical protein